MVQETGSPSTIVFVARQLIQRFIVESIGTLLEGSDRGVQERHVQLNSQHGKQAHEVSGGVYNRNVRRSTTRDCGDSTGGEGGDEEDSQGQQVCFESSPAESKADVTTASKADETDAVKSVLSDSKKTISRGTVWTSRDSHRTIHVREPLLVTCDLMG